MRLTEYVIAACFGALVFGWFAYGVGVQVGRDHGQAEVRVVPARFPPGYSYEPSHHGGVVLVTPDGARLWYARRSYAFDAAWEMHAREEGLPPLRERDGGSP